MEHAVIKYTIIKNRDQYNEYCDQLGHLLEQGDASLQDEIDLVTLLIEKYDEEHNAFNQADPIKILRSLIADHHLKPQDLTAVLGISKGYISDILNYKKGLSKTVIRKLAEYFKMKQEAFNRPYNLLLPATGSKRTAISSK